MPVSPGSSGCEASTPVGAGAPPPQPQRYPVPSPSPGTQLQPPGTTSPGLAPAATAPASYHPAGTLSQPASGATPPAGTSHITTATAHTAALASRSPAADPGLIHAAIHWLPWLLQFPAAPVPLLPRVAAALVPYSWLGLAIAMAMVLNGVFITYLISLVTLLMRHKPRPKGVADRFGWHFLVPCRDEEAVIGGTLGYLTKHFPLAHVWVIDDDSDDATGAIVSAQAAANPHVHLVARKRPDARTGKSEALNAAYRLLSAWLDANSAERPMTIVAVVDADGRLAPGSLDIVAGEHLFDNPSTGAVQIEVRMINRTDPTPLPRHGRARNLLGRVLIRLQDIEFRTVCSAVQLSRRMVRTVAMGGNGQFMRMTVLDAIGGPELRPWRGSLQEDFEIGLHVLLSGYKTEYTPDTYVDQEALPDPGRLVVQRTRWSQGMMQCIRYLPELWRSRHLSASGVTELSYCLIQPWVQLLATLLFPLPWVALGVAYLRHPADASRFGADGGWSLLALYVVAALLQLAVWGIVYWRKCERDVGMLRAFGYGVAFSLMVYISYLATWRAFFRIVRRRNGWAKTRRNAEFTSPVTPACDAQAA
jgi:1,2-diacylglycerol 3-beta-glucosyltransferase